MKFFFSFPKKKAAESMSANDVAHDVADAQTGGADDAGMRSVRAARYLCHVYDRGTDVAHVGSFIGDSIESVLDAVYDAIVEARGNFTSLQQLEAQEAWLCGERYYELDEDGFSLAFMKVTDRGLE